MKRPAPVLALVYRQSRRLKQQRIELDRLRAELVVQARRTGRWRELAAEMAWGNPTRERVVGFQALSDDLADAPEVDARNAGPRSAP